MINTRQLKDLIIEPALLQLHMHSEAAVNLLLGTCAVESAMGEYIAQIKGPAQGIFQMEPATYRDIWENYLAYQKPLAEQLRVDFNLRPHNPSQMVYDLRAATVMCRIHYRRVPEALPAADDIYGLGEYWKTHYNTVHGKGTVEKFVRAFERYVMGELE